jgi:GNAT superfamily N-acetyltransferase
MRHWSRLVGRASPGAHIVERDGVVAVVVPAAPERSVVNSVVYENAAGLSAAYDEVAAAYAEAGASWTVWAPSGDGPARALLERAGHRLDGEPHAMATDLTRGVERPPEDALEDWTSAGDPAEVGPLNDRAYTFGTDSFTRALSRFPGNEAMVYLARRSGRPEGCLVVTEHRGNANIDLVAVVPEARGQGIAGRLLAHALADAAERGVRTGTLVSTKAGRPVYERVGYRPVGVLEMWERRAASSRLGRLRADSLT